MPVPDAIIIGGGPAGLATAIAIAREGLSVALAEALSPPIDKACGEGLMPESIAALASLGVYLPEEAGYAFRGIRLIDGDYSVDSFFPKGQGLGLRRIWLHQRLAEEAHRCGVELMWGTPVTGVSKGEVQLRDRTIAARWIIGADGLASRVRKWAGLEGSWRNSRRFGFRRHYQIAPWSDYVEIYWGPKCQIYVTPVAPSEVCVALICRDPAMRLDQALRHFPVLCDRLRNASISSTQKGALVASRKLRRVYSGNVALIGDAAGSVDAITGQGLGLAFAQAISLAGAIASGNLGSYQAATRQLWWRPAFMADFILTLGESPALRARTIRALRSNPHLFARMLAMHVGELTPARFALTGVSLGARMLVG